MSLALCRPRLKLTAGINDLESSINTIVYQPIVILINDIKVLITAHVKSAVQRSLGVRDPIITTHGNDRLVALKRWLKSKNPLSWKENGQPGGNYALLSIMLRLDPAATRPLLAISDKAFSYKDFAMWLQPFITKIGQPRPAPLTKNGGFQHAIFIAYQMVLRLVPPGNDSLAYWSSHFGAMFKTMEIHLLPWHKNTPRSFALDYSLSSWTSLCTTSPLGSLAPKSFVENVFEQASLASDADPFAPWDIPAYLGDMKALWQKKSLPSCWLLEAASLKSSNSPSDIVYLSYKYVLENYDGAIWSHHLALIIAICFSRVVPYICFDQNYTIDTKSSSEVMDTIRSMEWIKSQSPSSKGTTAPLPFVVMMLTALISFWDRKSLFAKHLAANSHVLGKSWTDKHGAFPSSIFLFFSFL